MKQKLTPLHRSARTYAAADVERTIYLARFALEVEPVRLWHEDL